MSRVPHPRSRFAWSLAVTCGGAKTPFFITRNEKALSDERPQAFRLYRVFEFARAPRLFTLEAPLERALVLDVGTWRAGFG